MGYHGVYFNSLEGWLTGPTLFDNLNLTTSCQSLLQIPLHDSLLQLSLGEGKLTAWSDNP